MRVRVRVHLRLRLWVEDWEIELLDGDGLEGRGAWLRVQR